MNIGGVAEALVGVLNQACPALAQVDVAAVLKNIQEDINLLEPEETLMMVTKTLYVDKNRVDDYTPNGSIVHPYKTIQSAIDYVETSLIPSNTNPIVVKVANGIYNENVIIKKDGVNLQGEMGQGVCRIQPSSGVALIITNATSASLAAFLAAGGGVDPMTHYGLLVEEAFHPWDNQFRNICFGQPAGPAAYCLMFLGVGAGSSICGNEANFQECTVYQQTFARGVNYIAFQDDTYTPGKIVTHNIAGLWANRIQMSNVEMSYNVADDEPSDNGNYGLSGGPGSLIYGSLKLSGSARSGYDRLDALQIASGVDLNDTASFRMEGGFIGGNIDVEGGAQFRLRGVHVQGNISLADVAPKTACIMDGGRYMGVLTDVGVRLTRNVGA